MLTERYEQLRAVVLGRHPGSVGLGLGVLAGRGLAAWITVWQSAAPPPACSIPPAARAPHPPAATSTSSSSRSELVGVLAAMTLAHL